MCAPISTLILTVFFILVVMVPLPQNCCIVQLIDNIMSGFDAKIGGFQYLIDQSQFMHIKLRTHLARWFGDESPEKMEFWAMALFRDVTVTTIYWLEGQKFVGETGAPSAIFSKIGLDGHTFNSS